MAPSKLPDDASNRAVIARTRARAHWNVAIGILAVNGVLYLALLLLIAYRKTLLGQTLMPGLSLAIVFGAIVTIASWLLTLVYVRWANTTDHARGAE